MILVIVAFPRGKCWNWRNGPSYKFYGTDTLNALVFARKYYNEKIAAYSVPASEHEHNDFMDSKI